MDELKDVVRDVVGAAAARYQRAALDIHGRPEVSNHEVFACETLAGLLRGEGFTVTVGVAGHPTGFTAVYKAARPGPVLVFLAEYDALAGIGHACGHNLFGAASCLAGAAFRRVVDQTGGEVRVYGTPGEEGGENGSAKGSFVREGLLAGVDAALCCHPGSGPNRLTGTSLGCAPVDIEFWGRAAHAAAAPEKGVNALDALIQVYNSINALRQHLPGDVRIHGVIVDGGDAPNIVPDYARAKFYLRAATAPVLDDVYAKVERVVEGAALATGAKGRMRPYQNRVENTIPTPSFDALFLRNLEALGETAELPDEDGPKGSTDVGNISQVVPVIQPSLSISAARLAGHSVEMRDAACSPEGLGFVPRAAAALAMTAVDLAREPAVLAGITAEHRQRVAAQGAGAPPPPPPPPLGGRGLPDPPLRGKP